MGLESAREAVQAFKPSEAPSSAPTEASEVSATPSTSEQPEQSQASEQSKMEQIYELEKLGKFKYGGKEMTADDLKKAMMFQSDYTKKSQALAKEREYAENVAYDLEHLAKDPSLIDQFKKVYPTKYHAIADAVVSRLSTGQVQQQQQQVSQPAMDPKLIARLERLEQSYNNDRMMAQDAHLEATFKSLSPKYKMADELEVMTRIDIALERGDKVDDAKIEQIFKQVHEKNQKRFEQYQKELQKEQLNASKKASDIPASGGTPGQAPQSMKLKDVKDHIERAFSQR